MARCMLYFELVFSFLLSFHGCCAYGFNITRYLCLDTPLKFVMGNQRCFFTSSKVDSLLATGQTTCPRTCKVSLLGRDDKKYFGLKTFQLTFHDGTTRTATFCSFGEDGYYWYYKFYVYVYATTLNVDCTKWKIGTIDSEDCRDLGCVCKTGFISIDGYCYAADVPLGQTCERDMQCTRIPFSGVCVKGACACQEGYINYNNTCYPDKVLVGGACVADEQCTAGTAHIEVCKHGRCVCKVGYISIQGHCHRADVPLGQKCVYDMQCRKSPFLGACVNYTCACHEGYMNHNNTCYPDKVLVGGICVTDEQCSGTEHSGVCEDKRCTCKEGYLSIPGHCYRGNISLNQSCELHEQCTATPHAVCQNKTCTCEDGYSVVNTTYCEHQILPAKSFEQLQADGNGPVSIVGALIGGLVGGVLITTLIACILYKRSNTNVKKREEPAAMFMINDSYGSNSNIERGFNSGTKEDKPRKVVNVPPYARSADSPTYSNVREASEQPPNDDVYNHLHEEEKQDTDDDYDHTTGITDHVTEDSDYSHLHSGGGNRRLNLSVDDEYANASAVSVDTSTDDYFTLEKQ